MAEYGNRAGLVLSMPKTAQQATSSKSGVNGAIRRNVVRGVINSTPSIRAVGSLFPDFGKYMEDKVLPNAYAGAANALGGYAQGALTLPSLTAQGSAYLGSIAYNGIKNMALGKKDPWTSAHRSAARTGHEYGEALDMKGPAQLRRKIDDFLRKENYAYLQRNGIDPRSPDAYDLTAMAGIGLARKTGDMAGVFSSPMKALKSFVKSPRLPMAIQSAVRKVQSVTGNSLSWKAIVNAVRGLMAGKASYEGIMSGIAGDLRGQMTDDVRHNELRRQANVRSVDAQ